MNDMANKNSVKDEFTQIYHQYSKQIYRYCLSKLGLDAHKAEDCMQNTFIVLFKKLQNGEEIIYPGTFLFRTADKIVLNTLSKASKEKYVPLDAASKKGTNALSQVEDQLDYELLTEKIQTLLNSEEFELFQLKYTEGLTLKEASDRLGITKPAAAKRLQRIRDKLKNSIKIE